MFKILTLLRDLNTLRQIDWHVEHSDSTDLATPHQLVVRIPIDDTDLKLLQDMQAMFSTNGTEH